MSESRHGRLHLKTDFAKNFARRLTKMGTKDCIVSTSLIDSAVWEKWRQFEIAENSPGFFLDLLQTGLTSTPPLMASLKQAFADQDIKNVI